MEIHVTVERLTIRLTGDLNMADIYDTIIAGIQALQSGDNKALQDHVAALDTHLQNVDDEVLGLKGDDTSEKGRLDAIEAGLGKIAGAVSPPASSGTPGSTPPPSSGGTTTPPSSGGTTTPPSSGGTTTPPSDGSQSTDQGPNPPPPQGIPAAGVGSETTGQVDTPKTV